MCPFVTEMAFYHLLLLLVPVIAVSGTALYYVRPTQPNTMSCPDQPCLTLDRYVKHSDIYFKSNTRFKFLPGTHHLSRPVTIGNVENITMESLDPSEQSPHVVALFSCENETHHCIPVYNGENEVCCAAFWIYNAHNIHMKRITVSSMTPNVSGVVLQQVSNAHVNLIITCSGQQFSMCIGLAVYETRHVEIHSFHVRNCSLGLWLSNSNNIKTNNVTAVYNEFSGVYLESTLNISIANATVTANGISGLYLDSTVSTLISSVTATHNHNAGVYIYKSNITDISNVTVAQNGWYGVGLDSANNTNLCNTKAVENGLDGIFLIGARYTWIRNTSASQNTKAGMYLRKSSNTFITNTTANYNKVGVFLGAITDTNIAATQNGRDLDITIHTEISDTTVMYNGQDGLSLHGTRNTHISSTTAMYNRISGMYLENANNTSIYTTTANHNLAGIFIGATTNTSVVGTYALNNSWHGLNLNNTTCTIITNMTVAWNGRVGVVLGNSTLSRITNMAAIHNGWHGLYLMHTNTTYITNTNASSNGEVGMSLGSTAHTHIINTTATYNYFAGYKLYHTNNTQIINTTAIHNGKAGIFLASTNSTLITNSTVVHNDWDGGVSTLAGGITLHKCTNTAIHNSLFTENNAPMPAQILDPTSLPAVVVLYYSTLHLSESMFTANNMSSIKAFASNLTVSGNLTFSDNTAVSGTAFIFAENSVMYLEDKAHISFASNHATDKGGVFHIATDVHYEVGYFNYNYSPLSKTTCFISITGNHSEKQLYFANNSANNGGDILYGGQVALGLDGEWNCLLSFKNISNISQNSYSLITSAPSRTCLCNETGQPYCLTTVDPVLHTIHPGQSINISAVAVGQDFGTVTGSVYAQFLQSFAADNSTQLEPWQYIQGVTQQKCNNLQYTILSHKEESETVLVLTTGNRNVLHLQNNMEETGLIDYWKSSYHLSDPETYRYVYGEYSPVYINISLLPCPPGFMLTKNPPFKCDCNRLLRQFSGVSCYIESERIGRSGLVWVGIIEDDHQTPYMVVSDYCSFGYCHEGESLVSLTDPDSQCSNRRSGILCGQCQPGLSVVLGSAQCKKCSNKYLALLIPFTLAGPTLVLFIKILDLTVSQGTLNGLIFFANVIKANEYIFFPQEQTNLLRLFIAWLNLDLGVETCFFDGLTTYIKMWMQFLFPLYVWSIAGFIILIAKRSNRVAKLMGNNSVPVLATLFFLSYGKLFRTIITVLSYTKLYNSQGHKAVWSADGNLDYLSPKHAPLFTVAVATLLFLWLPYTLLLFLGQWLHRCNSQWISCIMVKAKPFLDAHYGPLKGKYHYWFGALLLVKAAILLVSALIPADHARIVVLSIAVFAVILTFVGRDVYESNLVSVFDISYFMYLALLAVINLFTTSTTEYVTVATHLVIGIVLTQLFGLIVFKIFNIFRQNKKLMSWLQKRQSHEDEWEMYREEDFLRKTESDAEDEDDDGSGSVESFSTY